MGRPLRNAFVLGILVGLVVAVVRALRGDQSSASVGTGAASLPRPTPAVRPTVAHEPGERWATRRATLGPGDGAGVDPAPADAAPAEPGGNTGSATGTTWVPPVGGGCPEGFPIKAKESSRIFHLPDGTFYARTVPDRCYPTAAEAEADGYRPSKR